MENSKKEIVPRYISEQCAYATGINLLDVVSMTENAITGLVQFYQGIIDYMPGNIYWFDRDARGLGCNRNVLSLFGLSDASEFYGLTLEQMAILGNWREGQTESFKNDIMEVIHTGKPKLNVEEPPIPDRDGRMLYFLTTRVPLRNQQGQVIGIVGVSIDITDRKEAEEREKKALEEAAIEKSKAQAEAEMRQAVMIFAGSIAHDLRTPLSVVDQIGSCIETVLPLLIESYERAEEAELPLSGFLLPLQFDVLSRVPQNFKNSVQDMNVFIDKTLNTLSRVVTGSLTKDDLELCSANYCINNTLQRYPFEKDERQLVVWNTGPDFKFLGNPVLFIRVISNLLKNALYQIHQHKKGEISISVEEGGEVNLIRVKDTAGGAPPEVIEQLFTGYKTTKKEGTGVGLAFCRLTLKSFGGDIHCESVYGDYIEFILSLPKVS